MTAHLKGDSLNLATTLRVPHRVLMREVGEELVMLNVDLENYYGLNEVGARLMQLAERGATVGQIVEGLAAEYEVAHEQLESDVKRLAAELLAAGLLERA